MQILTHKLAPQMKFVVLGALCLLAAASAAPVLPANSTSGGAKRVLVVGDSWGTVVAGGSKFGLSFFARKLKEHHCDAHETSIAVPGTTADDWNTGGANADDLKAALKTKPDYVWIVLLGNDALAAMPDCAKSLKSAAKCGDELYASSMQKMLSIVDTIHKESPNSKVVGFGFRVW